MSNTNAPLGAGERRLRVSRLLIALLHGAVLLVGGTIDGYPRVLPTAIALETSKGDLALSIALGVVLMSIILGLNVAAHYLRCWAVRRYG